MTTGSAPGWEPRPGLGPREAQSWTAWGDQPCSFFRCGYRAKMLGIDSSRVSHRTRSGALYSYPGASGRRRYPDWQFQGRSVVANLAPVLARLPAGAHPVTVRAFMTTADGALVIRGAAVSPLRWLAAGGAPEPVAALTATLGEQV